MELVTKAEAYAHLRLDFDSEGSPDDSWLDIWIPAVSDAVALWLKDSWRLYLPELDSEGEPVLDSNGDPIPREDSNGDPILRPAVRGAVLIELERQYRSRGGEDDTDVEPSAGHGYVLGRGATSLLNGLRKTTVK
jgi:hypothetical protein